MSDALTTRSPKTRPTCSTASQQARTIQNVLFSAICEEKVTPLALSQLSNAWCKLIDTIRVMKGVPDPGVLRPDRDPAQLAKELQLARKKQPLDIGVIGSVLAGGKGKQAVYFEEPAEEPVETTTTNEEPTQTQTQTPTPADEASKESLLAEGPGPR